MPRHAPDTDELLRRAEQGDGQARQAVLVRHRERLKHMVAVRMDRRLAARHLRALERLHALLASESEGE